MVLRALKLVRQVKRSGRPLAAVLDKNKKITAAEGRAFGTAAKKVKRQLASLVRLLTRRLRTALVCPLRGRGSCFVGEVVCWTQRGPCRMGEVELPALALTFGPGLGAAGSRRRPDHRRLRLVGLRLDREEGGRVDAVLLRPEGWVREAGGAVYLEMAEMGARGWAKVEWVKECPPLPEGEGALVTGYFRHSWGKVWDVQVEGEEKRIGVTGSHRFWSVDRSDWVAAAELKVGERLLAADGSTPAVESFTPRQEPEPVYNIEVDGDHCYRVGQQGLLVHNASEPCCLIDDSQGAHAPYPGPYANLEDPDKPPMIRRGADFSKRQKINIRTQNIATHGRLMSDDPMDPIQTELLLPMGSQHKDNTSQIDHIKQSGVKGPDGQFGSNSYCNARIISHKYNQQLNKKNKGSLDDND
jgi:hypothetical protein